MSTFFFFFSPSTLRYKPIRRRVIWLIGQWISVKFKSDLRPMLYEAIRNLLQDQDLVVSVTKWCFHLLSKHWWYVNSMLSVKLHNTTFWESPFLEFWQQSWNQMLRCSLGDNCGKIVVRSKSVVLFLFF